MYRKRISLVLLILVSLEVFSTHPAVKNYSRKRYNAGSQNWNIIQHKNDWMYFANNKGLLEFDGNKWTIYRIKNYTNVRSLYYDVDTDRIYAGAFNEFGYYTHNENGVLIYNSLIEKIIPSERNFDEIWHINKAENTIYFQGNNEIFSYKEDKITRLPLPSKIGYTAVIRNSFIVSSYNEGVSVLHGNMLMKFPNSDLLKNKKVCAILPYQNDKILFVTDFHGVYVFNGQSVEKLALDIDPFLSENQVFCATIKDSKLAFGTVRNGLVVKNLKDNSNVYSNTNSGLQNNTILSIEFDNQDNLWLGLDQGIDYVQLNSPIYDLFGNNKVFGAGYCSIAKDNILYLGTNQGLYATSYPINSTPKSISMYLLPGMLGQVWSLALIDNTIFCGTDHGTFIINQNSATKITGIPGTWGFRQLKTNPEYILSSTYQGFYILKKKNNTWDFYSNLKGFDQSGVKFENDDQGNIWFSHWMKGISKLRLNETMDSIKSIELIDAKKGMKSTLNNTLFSINNKLFFSSSDGFYQYNNKTAKVEKHSEFSKYFGALSNSITLKRSPKGDIWCSSSSNFGRVTFPRSNQYLVDTITFKVLKNKLISGFEHLNFINDSSVLVSTEDGFSWIDLSKIKKVKSIFNVTIRNIYLTNYNDSVAKGYIPINTNEKSEFAFKYNSLRFEFVAPEYRPEGIVKYSCYLENSDINWSPYTSVNQKEYTKLKKRTYIFRVRAKSNFEKEIVETSYKFTIQAPWYESKIAYTIYLIIIVLLIISTLRIIKFKSEKGAKLMESLKEKELEEQEKKYETDVKEKRNEIVELKNQQLQYDLRHKAQELANSTMNLISKNEMLFEINQKLSQVMDDIKDKKELNPTTIITKINRMQNDIKVNFEQDNNWKKFAQNFDLVYDNYLIRLSDTYPQLTINDKKICAYIKMNLSSKEIAPLMNMSYRSVEMSRYRLRKKMNLERDVNLSVYLLNF